MSNVENLELTLRRRTDGVRIRPTVMIAADPDDVELLQRELDRMGRELDGRRGDGWQTGYELHVRWGREHRRVVSGRVS